MADMRTELDRKLDTPTLSTEPLLISAMRRADQSEHVRIRTVGTTIGGFLREYDEWTARMIAEAEQRTWINTSESYDAGREAGRAEVTAAVEAVASEWQRELDSGAIRDKDARYCWSLAVREVRAALADPAAHVAAIKAEALREAADLLEGIAARDAELGITKRRAHVWLRDRADRIGGAQ